MRRRVALCATTMLYGVVGCAFLATSSALAADLSLYKAAPPPAFDPAVSALNEKAEGYGGSVNGKSIWGGAGSITAPLGIQYGAQIDGNLASLDGSTFGAVAGHWFWRNPNQGLLGLYAASAVWDRLGGVNVNHVGGEGELYYGPFTLQGVAGVEFGNSASQTNVGVHAIGIPGGTVTTTTTFIDAINIKTRFFDQVNLKYYFNNDFDAYIGHRYLGGKNALALGAELARPLGRGLMGSAFVEGRVGESNNNSIWGGLKLYFGPTDKPLIARNRRDDPGNYTTDMASTALNNHAPTSGGTSSVRSCPAGTLPNGNCEMPVGFMSPGRR